MAGAILSSPTKRTKGRRTQADRSAVTRGRLLDSTIECLDQLGYARTSTPEIARRAGVSRGAQLHHFPTKTELVTSAVERLFERRHEEFLRAFAELPPDADRALAAIDLLWGMVSGPTFHAWLEVTVAARTDPEVRPAVAAMNARLIEAVERTFRELFPRRDGGGPLYDAAAPFAFALLDGLALHRLYGRDPAALESVLDGLRAVARLVFPHASSKNGGSK